MEPKHHGMIIFSKEYDRQMRSNFHFWKIKSNPKNQQYSSNLLDLGYSPNELDTNYQTPCLSPSDPLY